MQNNLESIARRFHGGNHQQNTDVFAPSFPLKDARNYGAWNTPNIAEKTPVATERAVRRAAVGFDGGGVTARR